MHLYITKDLEYIYLKSAIAAKEFLRPEKIMSNTLGGTKQYFAQIYILVDDKFCTFIYDWLQKVIPFLSRNPHDKCSRYFLNKGLNSPIENYI